MRNKFLVYSVANLLLFLIVGTTSSKNTQNKEAGKIEKIGCEAFWRKTEKSEEVRLKKSDEGRTLYVEEGVRCVKAGVLEILVYGQSVKVDASKGWYTLPENTEGEEDNTGGRHGELAGERVKKFRGIVVKRDLDSFTMTETTGGPQTTVLLTSSTEVKSHKRGVFRGSKEYAASYILRGLRLEVDGVRNSEGQLVADKIRFDEQDLRSAQAIKSILDPAEAEMNEKLRQQQQGQERLAGQIEENRALTAQAQASADAGAEAARKAQQTADYANNRINGLDDFNPIKTITVYFNTGSASLGPKAKATIDEAAAWIKTQNTKGWVMAVIGYADSTGSSQRNIDLSERRANAVIYYIVSKYKMPLNRLVQPFGYGQLEPVAGNTTKSGRSKNRRVEIRLMINKGIAGSMP